MRHPLVFILLLLEIFLGSCSKKFTDLSYSSNSTESAPKMNIFVPRYSKKSTLPVVIFVHGGNWNSGNKGTYDLLGRNFAKKGVVTVVPDYTLSPNASYDQMTQQIADVITWTKKNISKYNGNPASIYVTGHSAGGHLVALAVMNPKYGIDPSSISGIILNDAAGLDMKNYLETYPPTTKDNYIATWTTSAKNWKDASPIYFITKDTPAFMIYIGDKTYPSIKLGNSNFLKELHRFQPEVKPIFLNKKHIPMVVQYFLPWSKRYTEIIDFISLKSKK